MKKLDVFYNGWGEAWKLGTLADNGSKLLFEYSAEALREGLELSPIEVAVRPQTYGDFPRYLHRLPGFIADALPDGWGMLLMDRLFRQKGWAADSVSPLDRLAFIGDRALGALSFKPALLDEWQPADLALLDLAQEAHTVISGQDSVALEQLVLLGGSPHGARPKVLVHYDIPTAAMSTAPTPLGTPWLIKFQAQNEHKEVCEIEAFYADLARDCGLEMPPTRSFDLNKTLGAFGIERFDIERGLRIPVLTLAGLLHADFRVPQLGYLDLLRATRELTRDEREVLKAFERAVFNVLFNNRDDHSKNFSFRLGRDRRWRLAPGYDLTFNQGPGGEHQMDVQGKGRHIRRSDLIELARLAGISTALAEQAIDRMSAQAGSFPQRGKDWKIRRSTLADMAQAVAGNRVLLLR